MVEITSESERIMREYIEIWNKREYSKIQNVVSKSFVMYDPAAIDDNASGTKGEIHGPAALKTFIQKVVEGFPDFRVDLLKTSSNNEIVMYEGKITMTHNGNFYWIPPTERRAQFRYMGMVRIADGKVQEHRVYPPLLEIFRQLELLSPAILPYLPKLIWAKIKQIVNG